MKSKLKYVCLTEYRKVFKNKELRRKRSIVVLYQRKKRKIDAKFNLINKNKS